MMDEIEQRLQELTPRPAPKSLRAGVLAGVSAALLNETPSREVAASVSKNAHPNRSFSSTVWGCGVALMLVLSVGMNWWVNVSLDRRLAAIMGPPLRQVEAAEIAQEIAAFTDEETGEWMYQRLTRKAVSRRFDKTYFVRLDEFIKQLSHLTENTHETI